MITENLSTLKIHKLTQEQYDRELAAGRIDENALYLTPDEEIDLSAYATVDDLNEKTAEINSKLSDFATKTEVNNLVANKANVSHTHTASEIEGMPSVAYGTEDLEAGVSELETGKIYFVYE
jgi:hypothetical protein